MMAGDCHVASLLAMTRFFGSAYSANSNFPSLQISGDMVKLLHTQLSEGGVFHVSDYQGYDRNYTLRCAVPS
jgi:hypothetical protein